MKRSLKTTPILSVQGNRDQRALNRSDVTIPAKDWEAFQAWMDRPAELISALQELVRKMPPLSAHPKPSS